MKTEIIKLDIADFERDNRELAIKVFSMQQLTDDNEKSQEQLLNWLNFWDRGNHDDRTIAILY